MVCARYLLARTGTLTVAVVDMVESLRSIPFSARVDACRSTSICALDDVSDAAHGRIWLESARDLLKVLTLVEGTFENPYISELLSCLRSSGVLPGSSTGSDVTELAPLEVSWR